MTPQAAITCIIVTIALCNTGCHHKARRADCSSETCPPVGLGEPVPPSRGGRLPAADVPTAPGVYPAPPSRSNAPPAEIPEARGAAPDLPPRETLYPAPTPEQKPAVSRVPANPRPTPTVPTLPPETTTAQKPPTPALQTVSGFAAVPGHPGAFSGRKPGSGGFEALKLAGAKSVIYLHAPEADPGAARELAESQGLTFTALATSPENLRERLAQFRALVTDPAARPVYVIDETEVRAGSLWYLVFRQADYKGADVAQVQATSLGLPRERAPGESAAFWAAIREIVARP